MHLEMHPVQIVYLSQSGIYHERKMHFCDARNHPYMTQVSFSKHVVEDKCTWAKMHILSQFGCGQGEGDEDIRFVLVRLRCISALHCCSWQILKFKCTTEYILEISGWFQ